MQGEITLKPEWKKIYVYYCHGNYLWFLDEKGELLDDLQINKVKGIDYSKVFSIKNIITYYWWSIKQYLFWHNVHQPIGNFIKKHTNLHKIFYPLNDINNKKTEFKLRNIKNKNFQDSNYEKTMIYCKGEFPTLKD